MKIDKKGFLHTLPGCGMRVCIQNWDEELEKKNQFRFGTFEYNQHDERASWCMAQWAVYKLILQELYGKEYCFSRTDEYFGICTEDGNEWLYKVERKLQLANQCG